MSTKYALTFDKINATISGQSVKKGSKNMTLGEVFLIAVSLSADAFAVSVCKGLSLKKITPGHSLTAGLYFGIFQALMPLIGYFLASTVASKIADYSFYIAFLLLLLIGANMIKEAFCDDDEDIDSSMTPKAMLPLAVATSIDALAVGVSFALIDVDIFVSVSHNGIVTLVLSAIGVSVGSFSGEKFRKAASVVGGSGLILM